jgi:hypothetical protein
VRLRRPEEDAVLTAQEIAMVRQVLVSCSHLLAWAGAHAGPDWHEAAAEVTRAAGCEQTAGGLYYDACLAIDYLDFAAPAEDAR